MYKDDTREPGQVEDHPKVANVGPDLHDVQSCDVVHDTTCTYTGANNLGQRDVSYFDWSIWDVLGFRKKGVT